MPTWKYALRNRLRKLNCIDLIWSQNNVTYHLHAAHNERNFRNHEWCNLWQLHARTLPASDFNYSLRLKELERTEALAFVSNYCVSGLMERPLSFAQWNRSTKKCSKKTIAFMQCYQDDNCANVLVMELLISFWFFHYDFSKAGHFISI